MRQSQSGERQRKNTLTVAVIASVAKLFQISMSCGDLSHSSRICLPRLSPIVWHLCRSSPSGGSPPPPPPPPAQVIAKPSALVGASVKKKGPVVSPPPPKASDGARGGLSLMEEIARKASEKKAARTEVRTHTHTHSTYTHMHPSFCESIVGTADFVWCRALSSVAFHLPVTQSFHHRHFVPSFGCHCRNPMPVRLRGEQGRQSQPVRTMVAAVLRRIAPCPCQTGSRASEKRGTALRLQR